jgi:hypothetical protein
MSRFDLNEVFDEDTRAQLTAHCMAAIVRDESWDPPDPSDPIAMAECFALGEADEIFPMSPKLIAAEQAKDKALQKKVRADKSNLCKTIQLEDVDLIANKDGLIVVPANLQARIISWFHLHLAHPGTTRLEETLRRTFTWAGMRPQVTSHVRSCRQCQLCKANTKKHGHLPPKEAEPAIPWNRVNVDLVGPYSLKRPDGKECTSRAMTMIDPATGWFEITKIDNPDSATVQEAFDNTWLCRYPRPQLIGFDGGPEFKKVFAQMVHNCGMTPKKTTKWNPQSNGVVERVHQVLGDMLRTFELEETTINDADPWTGFLQSAARAIHSTHHTILEATPAQLVFG